MVTNQLYTVFGEELLDKLKGDPEYVPLPEYPRPQMKRKSFTNLNGYWDMAIVGGQPDIEKIYSELREDEGIRMPARPRFTQRILVPFSPEAALSGVSRQVMERDLLWYHKVVKVDYKGRLLLHFGAVDQVAMVFVNSRYVGYHIGGYCPFSLDITEAVGQREEIEIDVLVRDATEGTYLARGKQVKKSHGMFYTAQSGIWQTVWLEEVPRTYIKKIKITPDYDGACCKVEIRMNAKVHSGTEYGFSVGEYKGEDREAETFFSGKRTTRNDENVIKLVVSLPEFREWSPEDPYLYSLSISVGEDKIDSYFAMRKCSLWKGKKKLPRLFLNNKPYFQNGILDQGYWPEGLYTPPTDEAMVFDIVTMKKMGFNMLRKHAKIEPARWYYWCDMQGMLVWQDMVQGGDPMHQWFVTYMATVFNGLKKYVDDRINRHVLSRSSEESRQAYREELRETIDTLYNCPCIYMWVPFNEGWGQFNALEAVDAIRHLDSTRLIDHASGWFDQLGGDCRSLHIYFTSYIFHAEKKRALVLSEFGGYSCPVKDHMACNNEYGYKRFNGFKDLQDAILKLYVKEIAPGISHGLSATVYTQLSDIEEEINGLLSYDRKVVKSKPDIAGVFEKYMDLL